MYFTQKLVTETTFNNIGDNGLMLGKIKASRYAIDLTLPHLHCKSNVHVVLILLKLQQV